MDRLLALFAALIAQYTARFDYHAAYPSTVVSQNGDGTLELLPDDPRWGKGLSAVRVQLGLPGATVKVRPGARVLLQFAAGNPKAPVATLWEADGLDTLTLTAQTKVVVNAPKVVLGGEDGSEAPVARLGDVVECLLPPAVPVTGTVAGAAFAGVITITDKVLGVIDSAAMSVFAK